MADEHCAWVVIEREGVKEDDVATRVYCPEGRPCDVDTLKKAAKMEFVHGLAHVDAMDLSVSMTRDGEKLEEDAGVPYKHHGVTYGGSRQQPLYIHAPAPSQAPVASMAIPELPGLLREMEDKRLQEESRREERLREMEDKRLQEESRREERLREMEDKRLQEESRREERLLEAISAIKGQRGSQEAPGGALSTTSFLSSYWLGVQSLISTLTVRNGSSIDISPTCLPTNSSGFSHRISAPGSRNASVSEAEAAPLLRERGGSSCTRRNGHSCQRE